MLDEYELSDHLPLPERLLSVSAVPGVSDHRVSVSADFNARLPGPVFLHIM